MTNSEPRRRHIHAFKRLRNHFQSAIFGSVSLESDYRMAEWDHSMAMAAAE